MRLAVRAAQAVRWVKPLRRNAGFLSVSFRWGPHGAHARRAPRRAHCSSQPEMKHRLLARTLEPARVVKPACGRVLALRCDLRAAPARGAKTLQRRFDERAT